MRALAFADRVTVVTGMHHPYYLDHMMQWPFDIRSQCDIVENQAHESGMFSSIQRGLQRPENNIGVWLSPVDTPLPVLTNDVHALQCHDRTKIGIPTHGSRRGHPVFIPDWFARKLWKLDPRHPDSRLDLQMAQVNEQYVRMIELQGDEQLHNLNTVEAMAAYHQAVSSRTTQL